MALGVFALFGAGLVFVAMDLLDSHSRGYLLVHGTLTLLGVGFIARTFYVWMRSDPQKGSTPRHR
jgi:hypothetical protein